MKRSGGPLGVLLLLVLGATWFAVETEARPRKGQLIRLSGQVLDAAGQPLPGVTVLYEASRESFSLRRLGKGKKEDTLRLPTVTGADGTYSLDLRYDPYYNHFELACAVPVRRQGGGETFEIFHRVDLGDRLLAGGVIQTDLVVEKSQEMLGFLRFARSEGSQDERRIVAEMGHPDRVKEAEQSGDETSWWYFAAGKAYYFLDGALQQVVHFEPIPPVE